MRRLPTGDSEGCPSSVTIPFLDGVPLWIHSVWLISEELGIIGFDVNLHEAPTRANQTWLLTLINTH